MAPRKRGKVATVGRAAASKKRKPATTTTSTIATPTTGTNGVAETASSDVTTTAGSTTTTASQRTATKAPNRASRKKTKATDPGEEQEPQQPKTKTPTKATPRTSSGDAKTTKETTKTVVKREPSKAKRLPVKAEYDEVWKHVYLAGTEWDQMKQIYSIDWDFDHLDEALSTGDLSEGQQIYLFGATEPQLVMMDENDTEGEVVPIPAIIAVVSDAKPPSQVGIKSVQRAEEEIVPMSELRIEWTPYIPDNVSRSRKFKPNVHILGCSQRRARLRNMKEEAVHRYDYVLPYFFDPEKQEEIIEETEVQVLAELEGIQAPLMCEYDYEMDELDEFVDEKIEEDELDADKHKAPLKKAIQEAVKVAKQKYRKEKEERQNKLDAISPEDRAAIKNTKLIKFYPMNEWPNVSPCMSPYINRYYGKASELRGDMPDEEEEQEEEKR